MFRFLLFGYPLLLLIDPALSADPRDDNLPSQYSPEGKVCNAIDARNSLEALQKLQGCRVVEGPVQILLMDLTNQTALSTISFPELTEITDYLLLYRVHGLRSLGQLFPNLSVIRGHHLFFSYALIIFELPNLQEIDLHSLTDITHGMIRIDENPSLCFLNSIDWDHIAHDKGNHFIRSMKPASDCPLCPKEETHTDDTTGALVHTRCPIADKNKLDDDHKYLCWSEKHCQKKCPSNCHACNNKGECCSSKCLGGCTEDIHNCTVCKNFEEFDGTKYVCQDACSEGLYEYLGRRCISSSECLSTKKPMLLAQEGYQKIHNNSCVPDCPTNFISNDEQECVPCNETCEKRCNGLVVSSITLAKQLKGCTHIIGSLEIDIHDGTNVVRELEENLGMIEDISGYLKIVRSSPLVSLRFLRHLRRIKGEELYNQKYAFVILDNQNLEDLWDWEDRHLTIDEGQLYFHYNPKLCLHKIAELQERVNLPPFSETEVAKNSNGDKIACDLKNMVLEVKSVSNAILLTWDRFEIEDSRKLLGYLVYSIEAPYQNVTLYDDRDASGGDGWRMNEVVAQDSSRITYVLTNLTPYTQYAFYVKTYTIATENHGAQSQIQYARTKPAIPSPPEDLHIVSSLSHALQIEWKPPLHPNGNVTHYIITGRRHASIELDNRDYCQDVTSHANPNGTESWQYDGQQSTNFNEEDAEEKIEFENSLQNHVYVKRPTPTRQRSKRENSGIMSFPHRSEKELSNMENVTTDDLHDSFRFTVNTTKLTINTLYHYTYYDISVRACREPDNDEYGVEDNTERRCSAPVITTKRTQIEEHADQIATIYLKNQTSDFVTITWDEPQKPNGIILVYNIEIKGMNTENTTMLCVNRQSYLMRNSLYGIPLSQENYSIRVRAVTSAQSKEYTPSYSPSLIVHLQ